MGGLGTAATTLITTKGLWIDDGITSALEFGAGITPFFRLWVGPVPTPPVNPYVAAAGSRVFLPGEIQNLYKELRAEQQYYVIPRDQEAKYFQRNRLIKVHFSFAGKDIDRTYAVSENKARLAFKVINLMNDTKKRAHVSITNFKRVATMAKASVRNLRLVSKRR